MAPDNRIPDAIDEFLTQLRADLDTHGATLAATLLEHTQQAAQPVVMSESFSSLTRLLAAVRRLDESTTLSGILDVLTKEVADESLRVAVLLGERDGLSTTGMTPQTSIIWMDDPAIADMPLYVRPTEGEAGLIAPLVVAGEVVGAVFAAGGAHGSAPGHEPAWAKQIELLVRHAAGRLENVTSERTVAALTRRA
jgi:hypothetical protein